MFVDNLNNQLEMKVDIIEV